MKSKLAILGLFVTILLSGCGQPKWEYLIESIPDASFSKTMDTHGENGWEMISARRASDGKTYEPTFSYEVIFKRQK